MDVAELKEKQQDPPKIPELRRLTINLIPPQNESMPAGSIYFFYTKGHGLERKLCTIPPDGIIRAELMVNPDSKISVLADQIPGYVVAESFVASMHELNIDCTILPAGGAALTCVDEKKNPVTHYTVSVESKGGAFQL